MGFRVRVERDSSRDIDREKNDGRDREGNRAALTPGPFSYEPPGSGKLSHLGETHPEPGRVATIRRWRNRWRRGGIEGLVPTYPRYRPRRVPPAAIEWIHHARQELGLGAARTRLWLQRVHGVRLAMGTIQRVFRDVGMPRLRRTRKRDHAR